MTLACDACGEDLSDRQRPEVFVPLAGGHGVDLCDDCSAALLAWMEGDADRLPAAHAGDVDVTVVVDEHRQRAILDDRDQDVATDGGVDRSPHLPPGRDASREEIEREVRDLRERVADLEDRVEGLVEASHARGPAGPTDGGGRR